MNEVVSADGQTVAVAAYLPNGEVWVSNLCAGGNCSRTSVYGLHGISLHIIRQTTRAADARNHCRFVWRDA